MDLIKMEVAARTTQTEKQELVCKGFAVDFVTSRIIPDFELQMHRRSAVETPVLDEQGEPTGELATTYTAWEIDRRYSRSGSIAVPTESNNSKLVDPQTFEFATEETENPIGEVDAIWSMFGPGIEQLLTSLMSRMISRGNLENPFTS